MFLIGSWPSVVTFYVDLKSYMALWPLIGWHIFNFFSRMTVGIYSKLSSNFPDRVLTKCCYFLCKFEILYGSLASDWLTHCQFLLKNSCRDLRTPKLAQMFFMGSWPSVVFFHVDQKSKLATLASDWLTYKKLIKLGILF